MASSTSDLCLGSSTAYSKLELYEKQDLNSLFKTNRFFPHMICFFGHDKLVAFSKDSFKTILCENVCHNQKMLSSNTITPSIYFLDDSCSTALDGNRFVLSLPKYFILTIYSSENPGELKEDGTLNVDGICNSIDFISGKLVVCFKEPPKISVLDMNTGIIQSIENEPKGNKLFTAPSHVAADICIGQCIIYVSDKASWGLRRLTKIDTQGNMLSSFLSLTKEEPKQVMAVGDGSVLFVHGGIRLMSESCKEVVKLLDENPNESFMCMCYSKQRNLLFLVKGYSDVVVYRLI